MVNSWNLGTEEHFVFLKAFWDADISNAIGFGVASDTGIECTGIERVPANINVSALVMFSGYLSSQLFFMVLLPLQAAHRHEPGQSMFFLKSDLERQKKSGSGRNFLIARISLFLFSCAKIFRCFLSASETLEFRDILPCGSAFGLLHPTRFETRLLPPPSSNNYQ